MVDGQPALGRLDRWGAKANLVRIPPPTASCLKHDFVIAPMMQIGRIRDPHVSAQCCDGPMNERPVVANPSRKKSRVLIFRLHNDAESFKALKVSGHCERDSRPSSRKGSIGHRVFFEFRNIRDAGIFNSPDLLWKLAWTGHQRWLRIDDPTVDSVSRAGSAQVRHASAVLHPTQQERLSILEQSRACIEDAVYWIRPILSRQNGIAIMTSEKRRF